MTPLRIEKLARHHSVDEFRCGQAPLDRFLARFALANQLANASQTYVGVAGDAVIGFYTLVVGVATGLIGTHVHRRSGDPVPVMVLARLAVAEEWPGQGIASGLLKDAVLRTLQAAEIAGIRALIVHAKDEQGAAFYQRFDFARSPSDPLHRFVLIKDLRAALR